MLRVELSTDGPQGETRTRDHSVIGRGSLPLDDLRMNLADRAGIEPAYGQVNSLLPYRLGYRPISFVFEPAWCDALGRLSKAARGYALACERRSASTRSYRTDCRASGHSYGGPRTLEGRAARWSATTLDDARKRNGRDKAGLDSRSAQQRVRMDRSSCPNFNSPDALPIELPANGLRAGTRTRSRAVISRVLCIELRADRNDGAPGGT